MRTIRAVICDDEQAWRSYAERALAAYALKAGVELDVHSHASGAELLAANIAAPDVLFSDIKLGPSRSGIDLVRQVAQVWPSCQVVYVTNYLRYAPDVYSTEHLWFVLKDQFEERLPEVMEKLGRQLDDAGRMLTLETIDRTYLSVPCSQVISLERRGRTTTVFIEDDEPRLVADRLPSLLERLPERLFVRCHGSFAVNLDHVRILTADAITMDDGSRVPVSRRYSRAVRERYLDWADDHIV
ncbi:MAG: response regulator transcription factor [Atopobiaceae bacterium]|nr:response regulator transcription factor [Atopobiaceae bacterium]